MSRRRRQFRDRPRRQVAKVAHTLGHVDQQLQALAARLGGMDGRMLTIAAQAVRRAEQHVSACRTRLEGGAITTPAGEVVAIVAGGRR